MRITRDSNRIIPRNETDNINAIHGAFQQKWGSKVNKDVIKDLNAILQDPECLKNSMDIWKETKRGYKRSELEYIRRGYAGNLGMKNFLYRLSEHGYYRDILNTENPLLTISDVLGNLIQKANQANGSGGSGGQRDEEAEVFQDIVKQGKMLLDLLDDPTMQEALQPGCTGDGSGDQDDQDQDSDSDSEDGDSSDSKQPKDDKPQGFDRSKAVDKILNQWDATYMEVMQLCQDLDFSMQLKKSGLESPTEFPEDGIDIRGMQSHNEITRALPSQMALPSDIFYQRVARQELLIKEWTTKKERKNILYMLLDKSGSMGNFHNYYGYDRKSKIRWAASVAISYLRKMIKNGDIFAFRFFADDTGPLHIAETPEEGGRLINHIFQYAGDSGGTNIQSAVDQAIYDISEKKDKRIEKADILLISDGEDQIKRDELNKKLHEKRINLHTVMIGKTRYGGADDLKAISRNFLQITNEKGYYKLASMFNKE